MAGERNGSVSFSLVKWYLDCVTEQGDTAIVYCADLRWRGVHARYSSSLVASCGAVTTQSSMARFDLSVGEQHIAVDLPKLGISGRWDARAEPVRASIYREPSGAVEWDCLQPASAVTLRIGDREFTGLGYAECLTLTLPPWQLPLRELRWGRFVSATDSVAWIDWRGSHSTRVGVHNGRLTEALAISDSEITVDDATLRLGERLTLRAGTLGATVFPGAGLLGKLLPASLRNIDERKWRSHATLATPAGESSGWAIHEVVLWNC
jgi:hypothetical protein